MIRYTVMYSFTPGSRFDLDYYRDKHLALFLECAGKACLGYQIAKGISAVVPGSEPIYSVTCDVLFDSVESFEKALMPHVSRIRADIPKFTDIVPVRQISEIYASTGLWGCN